MGFVGVALRDATIVALRYLRTMAARAVASSKANPAGPVHLNSPCREPLTPEPISGQSLPPVAQRDLVAWQGRPDNAPFVEVREAPPGVPAATTMGYLIDIVRGARRGLIIVGPNEDLALVEPI